MFQVKERYLLSPEVLKGGVQKALAHYREVLAQQQEQARLQKEEFREEAYPALVARYQEWLEEWQQWGGIARRRMGKPECKLDPEQVGGYILRYKIPNFHEDPIRWILYGISTVLFWGFFLKKLGLIKEVCLPGDIHSFKYPRVYLGGIPLERAQALEGLMARLGSLDGQVSVISMTREQVEFLELDPEELTMELELR